MGSRFWWRALDAQSPNTAMSQRPPARRIAKSAVPRNGYTLQIHRSERRNRRRAPVAWRNLLMTGLGLAAMCTAAAAVLLTPRADVAKLAETLSLKSTEALVALGFGIEQVSVTGQHYTSDADVFDALDLPNVPTFAAFNADAALQRIERISWVDTAQITRVFPASMRIDIRERSPAAIWARGEKSYLVDVTGRVLGPVPKQSGWELPQISGEGASTEVVGLLIALSRHKELEAQFDRAERIAERRWAVVLKNGTRVELGADREVEGLELVAENRALKQFAESGASVIDVRTPGRIAVRSIEAVASARQASAEGVRLP